jgi:EpsI family protein
MPAHESLDQMSPTAFGDWSGRDVSNLVAPKTPGDLASRLYDQTVERVYEHRVSGAQIMMLLAHGDTQSNDLQLHRPEVCYPAFGFEIRANRRTAIPLGGGAQLPTTALVASAPGRLENIVYWTRLGEFLPTTESEQRIDRVKTALHGVVADGLLARFSLLGEDQDQATGTISSFIQAFIGSVVPANRAAFVGSALAGAMGGHS